MDFSWSADVQYCDVQGGYGGGGAGNIDSNPLFRNPGSNDFRLTITFPSPISPCFDAGGDALVQPPLGAGRVDIRNFQRKNGTAVDMGAYENVATPVANFSATPIEILAGESVQFTDLSNTFGSWPETTWSWNFGDTGTSSAQNPSHQYSTAGKYSVSLTVQTAEGSDNETKTDYIVVHNTPVAQFSASPTSGHHPLTGPLQTNLYLMNFQKYDTNLRIGIGTLMVMEPMMLTIRLLQIRNGHISTVGI
jgi:PKD repeat protein